MNYYSLSEQVKQYSLAFFSAPENQQLPYHNLAHTEGVVKAAVQIGNHYQLDNSDFFVVLTAAWFHDMGYSAEDAVGHEKRGAENAALFLRELGVDELTISRVQACIIATRLPQSPANLPEQIVCDADLFHLGTDEFAERNKLMRRECEKLYKEPLSKEEWRNSSIQLMQSHHYHTEYCKLLLNEKKQENLDKLLRRQQAQGEKAALAPQIEKEEGTGIEPVKKKKELKELIDRPDKGIETMFRVAATNHQRLSDMSDNKAHIMISVNSIIISVIIGLVIRKLDASPNIIVPTLILLTGSLCAIVFAVLATRPKIPNGLFSKAQVDDKTVNLLFFGNFYRMDFSDYYEGMLKVMADREFLYGSLTRDIYSQGKVLGNKYKLLRVSYTIFMYTLIVSIIAFAIATIFFA
ncbi:MAG: metal-dependent phosphohydrolase sub domain protein [Ferruginibacter sp.]|nr:metal-dependent phosphohydrolase sub domain protein [Ferruginibacter sp.]